MSQHASIWRSMLFVPAHVERFVRSARRSDADAVILDLEDSVPPAEKGHAREAIAATAASFAGGPDVIVRINRPWRACLQDIEAAVQPSVQALMIPKVHSAAHVRLVAEIVEELESERGIPHGSVRLFPVIESVTALAMADEIARADRLCGIMLGPEDFSLAAGCRPAPEPMLLPNQMVLFAARRAGVTPYGCISTVAEYKDVDYVREIMRRSYSLGFEGASCIHPSVIPILNEEFCPSEREYEHSRSVIRTFEAALAQGRGAAELNGQMIDLPVMERARRAVSSYMRRRGDRAAPAQPDGTVQRGRHAVGSRGST